MSVESEVIEIVAEKLKVDIGDVSADKSIQRDLGADSLDVVELVMELEERFELDEIPEEDVQKMDTVGEVIAYVAERKGGE